MSQYISLSVTDQEGHNEYTRDTQSNQEKDITESMSGICLKFVSSPKVAYLKERLYGKICTWVLECIPKSRSCQTVEQTQIEPPGKRGP
jgi:hypothetical protein